jgi:hypothetical protein
MHARGHGWNGLDPAGRERPRRPLIVRSSLARERKKGGSDESCCGPALISTKTRETHGAEKGAPWLPAEPGGGPAKPPERASDGERKSRTWDERWIDRRREESDRGPPRRAGGRRGGQPRTAGPGRRVVAATTASACGRCWERPGAAGRRPGAVTFALYERRKSGVDDSPAAIMPPPDWLPEEIDRGEMRRFKERPWHLPVTSTFSFLLPRDRRWRWVEIGSWSARLNNEMGFTYYGLLFVVGLFRR